VKLLQKFTMITSIYVTMTKKANGYISKYIIHYAIVRSSKIKFTQLSEQNLFINTFYRSNQVQKRFPLLREYAKIKHNMDLMKQEDMMPPHLVNNGSNGGISRFHIVSAENDIDELKLGTYPELFKSPTL